MPVPTYDLFLGRANSEAVWIEAVEGLGNAYEVMTKRAAEISGRYLLICSRTHTVRGSIDTSTSADVRVRASA